MTENNKLAVVVATFHGEDNERRIYGPFVNGDEASRWGFKNFPNSADCDAVTWCWEELMSVEDDPSWPDTGRALRD